MEVTKWLKPSDSGLRIGKPRECAGRNASERRASLERDDVQADPTTLSGKADTEPPPNWWTPLRSSKGRVSNGPEPSSIYG